MDEFTVVLILHVDDTPAILATPHWFSIDNDRTVRADDSEGNHAHDVLIQLNFFVIVLFGVKGIEADIMILEVGTNFSFKYLSLVEGQAIGFGDDGDDIDYLGEFLHDDNVDGTKGMSAWVNKEKTTVNSGILNVTFTRGGQFFTQVRAVLILDVLDNCVPAIFIIDQISESRSVDDVETQTDAVFSDNMGHGVNLGRRSDVFVRFKPSLGVYEVRGEKSVD